MIHKCNASLNLVITGLKNELHWNFPLCSESGDFFYCCFNYQSNLWFTDLEISSALSRNNDWEWLLLLIQLLTDSRRAGERKESWLFRVYGPRYPHSFFPDYPVHLDQTHFIHLYFLTRNSLLFILLPSQLAHFFWISGSNKPVNIF